MTTAEVVSKVHRGGVVDGRLAFACFTTDGKLRWRLSRSWISVLPDPGGPPPRDMVWVMLNPSTADHATDDATIRRCVGYAVREGCQSVTVVNLFPHVYTRPESLLRVCDGDTWWAATNRQMIADAASPATLGHIRPPLVVCAWGAWGGHRDLAWAADDVRRLLRARGVACYALGFNKTGQPLHPLRLRKDAPLLRVS